MSSGRGAARASATLECGAAKKHCNGSKKNGTKRYMFPARSQQLHSHSLPPLTKAEGHAAHATHKAAKFIVTTTKGAAPTEELHGRRKR